MYFVYELVDPRTDIAGYVGITDNPNRRYYQHLECKDNNRKKREWIQRLREEQTQPKMKILEIVDDWKQAHKQERYWIKYYTSKGVELKNTYLLCNKEEEVSGVTKDRLNSNHLKRDELSSSSEYYTRKQARAFLDINVSSFNLLLSNRVISSFFLDEQSQVDYYLKSDIDELAAKIETLRKRRGSEGLTPHTIFTRLENRTNGLAHPIKYK